MADLPAHEGSPGAVPMLPLLDSELEGSALVPPGGEQLGECGARPGRCRHCLGIWPMRELAEHVLVCEGRAFFSFFSPERARRRRPKGVGTDPPRVVPPEGSR